MKKIYNHLAGKTKKEVLEIVKKDLKYDFNSDEWFLYLGRSYRWQRKYQYLLFEDNVVIRSSIIFKNLWDERILY
ncbi:uncharacterized protein CHSO_3389 [Chryseobacterium sp. StRB126]|uniref:hypothetical protein n=1 Tax=Chryseobacterium sp. StRB126 TaxID=878220 RepID=UPI0004E98D63|nr:hypothetical protein [Chryseobacterium sp. StRB126]BAP32426.1 uncharacterized protein CHSO_3389 [Chryseobacterium sp. StRB126]